MAKTSHSGTFNSKTWNGKYQEMESAGNSDRVQQKNRWLSKKGREITRLTKKQWVKDTKKRQRETGNWKRGQIKCGAREWGSRPMPSRGSRLFYLDKRKQRGHEMLHVPFMSSTHTSSQFHPPSWVLSTTSSLSPFLSAEKCGNSRYIGWRNFTPDGFTSRTRQANASPSISGGSREGLFGLENEHTNEN